MNFFMGSAGLVSRCFATVLSLVVVLLRPHHRLSALVDCANTEIDGRQSASAPAGSASPE